MDDIPSAAELWRFLPLGYLLSVALETPILVAGLSRRHRLSTRLFAGFWLTACTYPIVILVLPPLVWAPLGWVAYVLVAEVFAPLAECGLFYLAVRDGQPDTRRGWVRDMAAIIAANLVSFLAGLVWMLATDTA